MHSSLDLWTQHFKIWNTFIMLQHYNGFLADTYFLCSKTFLSRTMHFPYLKGRQADWQNWQPLPTEVNRCKQRLTKIRQMLLRSRRLELKSQPKLVPIKKKTERREMTRELKAETAANVPQAATTSHNCRVQSSFMNLCMRLHDTSIWCYDMIWSDLITDYEITIYYILRFYYNLSEDIS